MFRVNTFLISLTGFLNDRSNFLNNRSRERTKWSDSNMSTTVRSSTSVARFVVSQSKQTNIDSVTSRHAKRCCCYCCCCCSAGHAGGCLVVVVIIVAAATAAAVVVVEFVDRMLCFVCVTSVLYDGSSCCYSCSQLWRS